MTAAAASLVLKTPPATREITIISIVATPMIAYFLLSPFAKPFTLDASSSKGNDEICVMV